MRAAKREWMSRPERPEVGPQAQYALIGHNIGLGRGPAFITFVQFDADGDINFQTGLEWVLFHLERFDEPSRHMVLAAVATLFGIPYAVIFGDEQ